MAKPTVYRWDDPGAPVYLATMTSFKALIKAVMVDGYGSKPGAGWTIPFEDATSFILKQGGTNSYKHCMKFYNYHPVSSYNYVEYEVAEDYVSLSGPVNPWHTHDIGATVNYYRFPRGYATNTTTYQIPWIILATSRSVYFLFGYNGVYANQIPSIFSTANNQTTGYTQASFFGDYISYIEGFPRNTMFVAMNINSITTIQYTYSLTIASSEITGFKRMCSNIKDKNIQSTLIYFNSTSPNTYVLPHFGADITTAFEEVARFPNGINDSIYFEPVKLTAQYAVIGEMPGLLTPFCSQPFDKDSNLISFKGNGKYQGTNLYCVHGGSGQVFIHDGDWVVE